MGVIDPNAGIYHGQRQMTDELKSISDKLSKIVPEPVMLRHVRGNNVELYTKGKMIWWTKVELAARYRLKLFVKTEGGTFEIESIENDRAKLYVTFPDIPKEVNCLIQLEAENRDGEVIANGEIQM